MAKEKKNRSVWAVQDYGNLDVAEYLYNFKGGGGGSLVSSGDFSLEG